MAEPKLEDYRTKYDHVQFHRENGILEMKLHTGGGDLVWGFEPHDELGFCFADVGADPENEVIILTGTGETFIHDEELGSDPEMDARTWERVFQAAKRLIFNHLEIPCPMIAAVNGPVSVHSELAVLCDIVLSSEDTFFQDAPHFPSGLVPGDGMQVIWPLLLGLNRGRYFLLTGEKIDAQEALDLGVVAEVMQRDELLPRARELANTLLERPPLTVRFTRESVLQFLKIVMRDSLGYGLALEGLAAVDEWPTGFKH